MSITTEITRLQKAKADIKSAIEGKGVTVGDGLIDTYAEKVDAITGGDNHYDMFWDSFQNYGDRKDYRFAFAYNGWNDECFDPKYPIGKENKTATQYVKSVFEYNGLITDIKSDIIAVNTSNTTDRLFAGCTSLITIRKLKLGKNATFSGWFQGVNKLQNITIEGSIDVTISFAWSPLSKDSIYSVINALSDTTSEGTATFKKTAVNKAFETAEGANDGSTSDEWNTLVASKPNWSIALG